VAPGTMSRDKRKGGSTKLPGVDQPKGKGGSTRPPGVEQPKRKLEPDTVFRDKLKDGSQGPEMVVVPAGTFKMGDIQGTGGDDEKPVHTVSIAKPFAIGRYPITFDEYDRFASATNRSLPNDQGWGRGRQPAINVSWDDAVKWLSQQTGKPFRLPTEAEWEYAARAGTETNYWWGNEMKSGIANCNEGDTRWGGKQTSPVGSFQPNPLGLYDTAGNVWEWVEDCLHGNYKGAPTDGSAWLEANGGNCSQRMMRDGSWGNSPVLLRASSRFWFSAGNYLDPFGFRLVQDID
jgi:formylglycine-generating enzyme required for sulfatase activity